MEQRTAVSRAAPKRKSLDVMNESSAELKKLVTAEMGIQIIMIQLRNAKAGVKC